MAYEKYDRYVPLSERFKDAGSQGGAVPIPRVQITFNAHAFVRNKIHTAAERQDIAANEWLCNAVVDSLQAQTQQIEVVRMSRERNYATYNRFVPRAEMLNGLELVPRVQIAIDLHPFVRDKVRAATKAAHISQNAWLCKVVVDALERNA